MSDAQSNRLQSRVLLPFARVVMLWAAAVAFFVTVGGFAVGVVLYAQSNYLPTPAETPAPRLDPNAAWDPSGFPPEIEYEIVNTNRNRLGVGDTVAVIYGVHDLDPIAAVTLSPSPVSDRFAVVAPAPPRASSFPAGRYRVTARANLIEDLADATKERVYALGFVVNFPKKRKTPDARLDITIVFPAARLSSAEGTAPRQERIGPSSTPTIAPEAPVPTSEAARAAQALALVIDPMRTPEYFTAYERALRQIQSCGNDTEAYAAALNQQIRGHNTKLKRHNALRFEQRICALWRTAVADHAAREAERRRAIAESAAEALRQRSTSMIALYVAGSALATFLMLALALALLAIENHVRVIREGRTP